ncbi:UNVERIFIED_CONTAM: Reticulon-like protein B17 [Sesamum radiatum]|uniref:Reticulon-like protein B17 n=1 Tax=Sesamum radiatum TaxID=300843 RepID=A0AAW2T5B4_SESRA
MGSTPPSLRSEPRTRTKSASRLSKLRHYSEEAGGGSPIPQLSLEIVPSSPKISTPSPASTISPRPPYTLPLQELLMLSPSPLKRSKARLGERLEMADDPAVEACGVRKRCKSRSSAAPSPRSSRRSRRRVEQDMREERESVAGEEIWVKPRKKRHSERSRKDKSISVPPVPSLSTSDGDGCNLDAIAEMHFLIPISSGASVLGSVIFLQYHEAKVWLVKLFWCRIMLDRIVLPIVDYAALVGEFTGMAIGLGVRLS